MIISIIKFFRGYLLVRLEGFSPERFLNLCSNHNILIWNLIYVDGAYQFNISLKGFRKLKPIIHKTKTKLKIIERHGLPFFLHKYRKRKVFFIGILIFLILIYVMSLFIWDISLEGNFSYTEDTIIDCLNQNDIRHGLLKKDIDCEKIEKLLRNTYFDITWVSAEISGTRLIIHMKENFDDFVVKEEKEPYHLIADKDAIITDIITRAGTPLVGVGSVVHSGDMLVSGAIEIFDDSGTLMRTEYVNADADIFGKTVYQYEDKIDLKYKDKKYTEKKRNSFYIKAFDKKIQIFGFKVPYKEYDKVNDENQLKIARNFYLPFYFGKTKYREYEEIDCKYSKEEAIELANEHLDRFMKNLEEKGIQIVENNVKIEVNDNECVSKGIITVIEQLGKPETIVIPPEPEEGTNSTDEYN